MRLLCQELFWNMEFMGYIGKTRDLGITNLTVIDIPVLYGSYIIKNIIFVLPTVSYAHNITGILTINGKNDIFISQYG